VCNVAKTSANSILNYESPALTAELQARLSLSKLVAAAFSTPRHYGPIVELVEIWGEGRQAIAAANSQTGKRAQNFFFLGRGQIICCPAIENPYAIRFCLIRRSSANPIISCSPTNQVSRAHSIGMQRRFMVVPCTDERRLGISRALPFGWHGNEVTMVRLAPNSEGVDRVTHELDRDIVMIGHAPSNQIVIDHPKVSAQHAVLLKTGASYSLKDNPQPRFQKRPCGWGAIRVCTPTGNQANVGTTD
jgi:hypothetical protein